MNLAPTRWWLTFWAGWRVRRGQKETPHQKAGRFQKLFSSLKNQTFWPHIARKRLRRSASDLNTPVNWVVIVVTCLW